MELHCSIHGHVLIPETVPVGRKMGHPGCEDVSTFTVRKHLLRMAYMGIDVSQKSKCGPGEATRSAHVWCAPWEPEFRALAPMESARYGRVLLQFQTRETKTGGALEPTGGLVQLNRWSPCPMRDIASKSKMESLWERLPVLIPSLHIHTPTCTHVHRHKNTWTYTT